MQFESFHWLSNHELWAIIRTRDFWRLFYFYFSFVFNISGKGAGGGDVLNKTIILLEFVGHELIIAHALVE